MIIELAGPPGAGKSTLLPTVLACLQERGWQAYTVVDAARPLTGRTLPGRLLARLSPTPLRRALMWRLFLLCSFLYRARFALRHRRLMWHVLRWQRGRPAAARARQRKVMFWFLRLAGCYEFLCGRLRPNEALVVDEGFLHRAVQLFSSDVEAPDGGRIRRYVKMAPAPDLVVYVFAPPAVCRQRIYERGLWKALRGKEAHEVQAFVEHAHQASMLALKFARGEGWPLIEVDNSRTNEAVHASTTLKRELERFMGGAALQMEFGVC